MLRTIDGTSVFQRIKCPRIFTGILGLGMNDGIFFYRKNMNVAGSV